MNTQTSYLLALHKATNLTLPRFQALQKFFDQDWEQAFKASLPDWQASGIDVRAIDRFFTNRKNISPTEISEKIQKIGASVLIYGDTNFPIPLEQIPQAPTILFVRGSLQDTDFPCLSVVGTRNLSPYGRRALDEILTPIAQSKVSIVSGLAFGTDRRAHEIALQQKSRTIAVLGNGIDTIYPKSNAALGEQILHENAGAIISEYFPDTEVCPAYFPMRNRIIAGLSKATLIIEAGLKSGTLITANCANEQGRDVFAVPGDIFSTLSMGTNQLISDGMAQPLTSSQQLIDYLGLHNTHKNLDIKIPETGIESDILRLFKNNERIHIDELIRQSPLPQNVLTSNLMCLEVKGWVIQMGNQTYVRNV